MESLWKPVGITPWLLIGFGLFLKMNTKKCLKETGASFSVNTAVK